MKASLSVGGVPLTVGDAADGTVVVWVGSGVGLTRLVVPAEDAKEVGRVLQQAAWAARERR